MVERMNGDRPGPAGVDGVVGSDATCAHCGRSPEMRLEVRVNGGPVEVFDSWRCVLAQLAPVCSSCGGPVLDDGVLVGHVLLCSQRCADRWRIPAQPDETHTPPARAGDQIVVRGHRVDEVDRDAEILEARGSGGGGPYLVRWSDDGHVGLFFPGPDTFIDHRPSSITVPTSGPR